ncbi:MAG TPA: site-2 protease family protein [Thermomicrobiaceae bacterium]|nr:site-2 protease family protein [Thermomicrobiaceae bacterium]
MYEPNNVLDADYRVNPETGVPERAPSRRKQSRWRRLLAPLVAAGGVLAKLKYLLIPLKLLFALPLVAPVLTALISIGAYAWLFGWQFGVGIVALIFVHEMGHVIMLRRYGVKASAPIFIPFLGAFIGMKQLPKDALMEAYVGLAGPVLGTLGAIAAWAVYQANHQPLWLALTYLGVLLNLFNLLPVPPLDGGRAVAAISRWIWALGLVGLVALVIWRPEPILFLIVVFGGMELWAAWKRSRQNASYYQVPLPQRLTVTAIYFGLALSLGFALLKLSPMLAAAHVL